MGESPKQTNALSSLPLQFHMPRTRVIFDWVFGVDNKKSYELYYLESLDAGLSSDALQARAEKERASLDSVKLLAASHHSLGSIWQLLTSQHDLYTSAALVDRAKGSVHQVPAGDLVQKSYGA